MSRSRSAMGVVTITVAVAAIFAAYSAATSNPSERRPAAAVPAPLDRTAASTGSAAERDDSPGAAEFAAILATATNQFGETNGKSKRIEAVDCIKGAPADYMCSFEELGPTGHVCRLAHLRYTPELGSTVTVLDAGRVPRCGSVREAFRSLP